MTKFRDTYYRDTAPDVISNVEKDLKLKLQKQQTLGQGLAAFGIFHTNSSTVVLKEEDVPQIKKHSL